MRIGYLKKFGCGTDFKLRFKVLANERLDKIYVESSEDRTEYRKMIKELSLFDTLYIWSVDELGAERDEILEQWNIITNDIQARVNVFSCPILNSDDDITLERKFTSDVVLGILAYQAEIISNKLKELR